MWCIVGLCILWSIDVMGIGVIFVYNVSDVWFSDFVLVV